RPISTRSSARSSASWGRKGPGDRVGRHLIAEMVFDAQHVRADAFAPMFEAVAVAQQVSILQDNVVVAIGAVDLDLERFLVRPLEAFRLGLVTMCFRDQAVQVRLQHGACRALLVTGLNAAVYCSASHGPRVNRRARGLRTSCQVESCGLRTGRDQRAGQTPAPNASSWAWPCSCRWGSSS